MSVNTEWQLTGNAAELYEQFLVPTIFVPWAQLLLANYPPSPGESVLDIACGTGIVARMAKARVGPSGIVVGVDLNSDMLNAARSVTADTTSKIDWVEADVSDIPLEGDTFHAAYCQQGLQFFPDKIGALREIFRLLKKGGNCTVVVAQSLEHNPLMRSQVNALTRHVDKEAAAGIRAVCSLDDVNDIKQFFDEAGFEDVSGFSVDLTLRHPDALEFVKNGILSTPVANTISAWSDERRQALVDDILSGFGHYFDGKSLTFPHVSNVVSGRKHY